MAKQRLDQLLVARGLMPTRARARDAILRGHVTVEGETAEKPGESVAKEARITLTDPAAAYVSRGALKLIAGLEAFALNPRGRVCLDLGASTGGFTEVLLERGAVAVYALDVGHSQLHPRLRNDTRVTALEGVNAREITAESLPGSFTCLVADLSFISLKLALPPALERALPGSIGVFLVKPQFEVGRAAIGKGGLVREAVGRAAAENVAGWLDGFRGWKVLGLVPSPLAGGDGNQEYLLGANRD